jgi:cysteinyl-tRNA synthetase
MSNIIKTLISKGYAYQKNGSTYFRVKMLPEYYDSVKPEDGLTSGVGSTGPNNRKGVEDKEDCRDFVLWKAFTDNDLDIKWTTPIGTGRPGILTYLYH